MRLAILACFGAGIGQVFAQILTNPEYFAAEKDAIEAVEATKASISAAADVSSMGYTKAGGSEDLSFAMKRGWWDLSEAIIHTYKAAKVDLTATLYQSASHIKSRIQKLQDSLQKHKFTQGIGPAFRWAQSPDTVFIEQKFSHKWDTPATLGCKRDKLSIAGHELSFHATCSKHRKRFTLDLDLFRPIDGKLSSVTFNSVGRATISLRKQVNSSWPRLLRSRGSKPGNMHTWWSMKQKHEAELSTFEEGERNRTRQAKLAAEQASKAANTAAEDSAPLAASEAPPASTDATIAGGAGAAQAKDAQTAEIGADGESVPADADSPPPADAEAVKAAAAAKAAAEQRERQLRAVAAAEREELGKADAGARAEKQAIDAEARTKKQAVDERTAEMRNAISERFAKQRHELQA